MLQHALAPMADAFGDAEQAAQFRQLGAELLAATVRRFWSDKDGLFIDNLPWLAEERAAAHERPCVGDGHPV